MLTLYIGTDCLFSRKVLDTVAELGATFTEKNIADPAVAGELVMRGGQLRVPYLVDSDRGVEMYESADIDAYLRAHYPKH